MNTDVPLRTEYAEASRKKRRIPRPRSDAGTGQTPALAAATTIQEAMADAEKNVRVNADRLARIAVETTNMLQAEVDQVTAHFENALIEERKTSNTKVLEMLKGLTVFRDNRMEDKIRRNLNFSEDSDYESESDESEKEA